MCNEKEKFDYLHSDEVYFIETDTLFHIDIKWGIDNDHNRKMEIRVSRIYFEDIPKDLWTKIEGVK